MELPRESPFPTHRSRRITFVVNEDTYSAAIVTEQNTVICQSKQVHYLLISRLRQMAILLKSSSVIIVLFHKFAYCVVIFLCVWGTDGRKCETYCEIAHEQSSRTQQHIKNRNLKQNLPSTAHELYTDICGDVMTSRKIT